MQTIYVYMTSVYVLMAQKVLPSWAFEFAHFIASERPDGFGCSNGPELDVAPPRKGPATRLFAMHGDEVKFVFGNEAWHGAGGSST